MCQCQIVCYFDGREVKLVVEVRNSSSCWLNSVIHQRLVNSCTVFMKLGHDLLVRRLARGEHGKHCHQKSLIDLHRKLLHQQLTVSATATITHVECQAYMHLSAGQSHRTTDRVQVFIDKCFCKNMKMNWLDIMRSKELWRTQNRS